MHMADERVTQSTLLEEIAALREEVATLRVAAGRRVCVTLDATVEKVFLGQPVTLLATVSALDDDGTGHATAAGGRTGNIYHELGSPTHGGQLRHPSWRLGDDAHRVQWRGARNPAAGRHTPPGACSTRCAAAGAGKPGRVGGHAGRPGTGLAGACGPVSVGGQHLSAARRRCLLSRVQQRTRGSRQPAGRSTELVLFQCHRHRRRRGFARRRTVPTGCFRYGPAHRAHDGLAGALAAGLPAKRAKKEYCRATSRGHAGIKRIRAPCWTKCMAKYAISSGASTAS